MIIFSPDCLLALGRAGLNTGSTQCFILSAGWVTLSSSHSIPTLGRTLRRWRSGFGRRWSSGGGRNIGWQTFSTHINVGIAAGITVTSSDGVLKRGQV